MDWDLGSDPAGLLSPTWSLLSPCSQGSRGGGGGRGVEEYWGGGEGEAEAQGWRSMGEEFQERRRREERAKGRRHKRGGA